MRIETANFSRGKGWSTDSLPALDSERTIVFAFGASDFIENSEPIASLRGSFPEAKIVGCSTSGEILGDSITDGTLVVAAVKLDRTDVGTAEARVTSAGDSFAAGKRIASDLFRPGLRCVLVLSDGLNVNGSDLVRGLNSVLPDRVVVTGGLAGDGDRFKRTWVIAGGEPRTNLVTAVGLYGDHVRVGHGSKGGWDIFGPERKVTRSEGNVLFELDGRPALELYKEYLGARAAGLPATALLFPLALRSGPSDQKTLVRTVLSIDEARQSMTFAGDIPNGCLAQLMRANFERLIDGASDAAQLAKSTGAENGSDVLAIAISCVGRRLILGERAEEEIEAALDVLPRGTKQIGFYSYGEISPYASGHCDLHNQTMTLTTLTEG